MYLVSVAFVVSAVLACCFRVSSLLVDAQKRKTLGAKDAPIKYTLKLIKCEPGIDEQQHIFVYITVFAYTQ